MSVRNVIANKLAEFATKQAIKQDVLVSGTNIKTINSISILGSGNLSIAGGGGGAVDTVNSIAPVSGNISLTQDNIPSGSTNKVFTSTEQTKLAGIATSANNYTHPATHPPSIIVQDSSNRFATDAEKTTWNSKANGTHTHVISDVTNLQTSLDGKAPTSHAHPLSQLTQSGATTNQVATWNGEAWVASTPASGGSEPDWYGKIYGGYGRCDAQQLLRMATMAGSVAATPTNIGTGVVRIAYFRPPANIVLNKIRYFGVGNTTNVYRVAIYDGDSQNRLTAELPITTTAQQFGSVGDNMGLTLVKDQLYFMAVGVNAVGTGAGLLCMSATTAATTGQMQVLPKAWPGNLDIDLGFMDGAFAYFTTTNGALPTTSGSILAPLPWTGGFPLFFLDNNNG